MIKSKLIQLLKSLSPAEIKEFGRYLEGTSYRKGGALFTLFEYLKKQHPEFPDDKIEKKLVHKKTSKDKKPIGRRFFDLVSKLNSEVEQFLIQKKIKSKEVESDLILLSILRERRLDKMFLQKASLLEKNWEKVAEPGVKSLLLKYELLDALITHPQFARYDFDIISKQKEQLQKLDEFYVSSKFMKVMSALTHENFSSAKKDESALKMHFLLTALFKKFENKELVLLPIAEISARFIKANYANDYGDYDKVLSLFKNNIDSFSLKERIDAFTPLEIYCIMNHYSRKEGFIAETFALYSYARDNNILIEDGMILQTQFLNVVNVAQSAGEIEWTKSFINEYADYLDEGIRGDIVSLSMAKLLLMEGDYNGILTILATAKFSEVVYGVEARIITAQSYFMLGGEYDDLIENLMQSFRAFLNRREDLPEEISKNSLNFLHFLGKLHKQRIAMGKIDLAFTREGIESCTNLYAKKWLLEQFDHIKK